MGLDHDESVSTARKPGCKLKRYEDLIGNIIRGPFIMFQVSKIGPCVLIYGAFCESQFLVLEVKSVKAEARLRQG
jgi:hypothetical protein